MYQALYLKYRPRAFDDVVGQEHITETLKNQVRTGKLSHAYLFIGTRGTGKTTCAKILAKAMNGAALADIEADVKQSRLDRLMRIQQRIAEEVSAASIGQTMQVVIDREEGNYYVGRTQYDSPEVDPEVLLLKSENEVEIGHYYLVEITSADEFDLYGKVI